MNHRHFCTRLLVHLNHIQILVCAQTELSVIIADENYFLVCITWNLYRPALDDVSVFIAIVWNPFSHNHSLDFCNLFLCCGCLLWMFIIFSVIHNTCSINKTENAIREHDFFSDGFFFFSPNIYLHLIMLDSLYIKKK